MDSKKYRDSDTLIEWFTILEPCTKEEIFVNIFTGECVWCPPPGVIIKKSDDNLWWEIFDRKSSRFYYYNATGQKTVWQKPKNCDVLSLSKLQALKQSIHDPENGEIKKESTSTQTFVKISVTPPASQKSASTQTARVPHCFSSHSEHALSTYSYDSGTESCIPSHTSLDSTNYRCYRKLEFCSTESGNSFQDQNILQPNWSEQHNAYGRSMVPLWNSFDSPKNTPKQHSSDSSKRHPPQQFCRDKSYTHFSNESKRRSRPQHYQRLRSKNSLSFGVNQIKHASSYRIENNASYPPEAVSTPMTNRKRWLVKSTRDMLRKGTSSPLIPMERSYNAPLIGVLPLQNTHSVQGKQQQSVCPEYNGASSSLMPVVRSANQSNAPSIGCNDRKICIPFDLPLHNVQGKQQQSVSPEYSSTSCLLMPFERSSNQSNAPYHIPLDLPLHNTRRVQRKQQQNVSSECRGALSRQRYYNSCRHIYPCTTPDLLCCYQGDLSPLQQYLMEQARLSGNLTHFGEDKYSYCQSDDDDDHFADDEGMSRYDSSSLEYLDNYIFVDAGEHYYSPIVHPPSYGPNYLKESAERISLSIHDPPSCCAAKSEEGSTEDDIQKYAEDNLNRHTKGIFRKKFSLQDMLSWSKDPIRQPMITTTDKSLKRDACEVFKLIQIYMLDHRTKSGQTYEAVVLDIATRGWAKPALRDELYIQICRQTTENPKRESLVLGWELMAVCLTFFPPSAKFQPYLEGYIKRHQDSSDLSHYALVCGKRLEQISRKTRSCRKPAIEEIEQSRVHIFRSSMFGISLEEVMELQKKRFPNRSLPWVQTTLSETVLQLDGAHTEGIFRVPGDVDEINAMKWKIDEWELAGCDDPHVPASLLKQWYRELFEPLIPAEYYEECVTYCNDPDTALHIVKSLPELNRLVFSYLVRFLQVFAAQENCSVTKMDAKNLAMVMAPNCLRCTSEDPSVIFENTRKEMTFMQTLIQHLDTSYLEGVM